MKHIFSIILLVAGALASVTAQAQSCDFYYDGVACSERPVIFYPDCSGTVLNWYVDSQFVGSTNTQNGEWSFSYQFPGPGTYTVSMMSGSDVLTQVSHSVTVASSPNVPQLSVSRTEVCDSDASVQINVTSFEPHVTYSWSSVPSNAAFTGTGSTKSGSLSAASDITVSATSGGCTSTSSVSIGFVTTAIQPTLTAENEYHRRKIQYTGNSYGSYYWQTSASGTDTSTPILAKTFVTEPGDYFLRRYSYSGTCWSTAVSLSGVTINYQPPVADTTLVVKQHKFPGYTNVDIAFQDRTHVFQYARYYWVKSFDSEEIVAECSNGKCKLFSNGLYYLRGRDIGTGTWGPTSVVKVTLRGESDLNWIHTKAFDGSATEKVVSESKSYFDDAGKPLQSQSKALTENKVLATQSLTDRYNRSVGSTLPAPILGNDFRYHALFVQNQNGDAYTHTDFDTDANRENPSPVSQQTAGTLGWYYSDHNPDVTIPQTDFPYSRSFFYEDGSGEAKKSIGVGNVFRERPGHETLSGTFPVFGELDDYMSKRIIALPGIGGDGSLRKEGVQTIGRDENGRYVVSITDKSGKVVMTARQGMPDISKHMLSVTNTVTASADLANVNYQPLVYFYLWNEGPVTLSGSTDFLVEELVSGVKKSIPGETFADAQGNWPVGFYRMKINSGSVTLSYTNYYQDVSYQFYDDAGRLRVSVSPNGYKAWKQGNTPFADIDKTTYNYNHRGWLLSMTEPDAGTTTYKYRRDGKIRFSQNCLQAGPSAHIGKFSYTHYDALGRPVESGEYIGSTYAFDDNLNTQLEFVAQINFSSADVKDWVRTHYDEPASDFATVTGLAVADYPQEFIRGAVSWTENENIRTYYSYDELGRVTWMAQKPTGIARTFVLKYEYDFLGNVEKVANLAYVQGQVVEQFYHHYEYDADKRLSNAYTSTDGVNKKLRAHYVYYLHGPLKRLELGGGVQGIDFVYNIHGWLTQINHPNTMFDPNLDGTGDSEFRKDAFGIILEYYEAQPDPIESYVPDGLHDPLQIHRLPGVESGISTPSLAFGSNHQQLKDQLAQARDVAKEMSTTKRDVTEPMASALPVAYTPDAQELKDVLPVMIDPFEVQIEEPFTNNFIVSPSALTASTSSMPLPEVYTEGLVPDAIEFAALKDLYDSLAGSGWTDKTGWPTAGSWPVSATSTEMDAWFGIVVTAGDITEISMNNNNLTGKIPAAIGNLTKLKNLYLMTNKLSGRIPSSIGNLTTLENLVLSNNLLTGSIPSTIGSMTALKQLMLFNNQLSGSIPSEIGNLTNLWILRLYTNQLSGTLPSSIGSLGLLGYLEIAQNQLSGPLPASMSNLTNLIRIDLSNNQFTGSLPDVSGWTKLTSIEIGYTQLSGSLPAALGNLTTLTNLRIYNSNFSGEIPYLGNLTNLQFFYLYGLTNLTPGPVPDWIGNLNKVTHLLMSFSNRTGELPESLRKLTKLTTVQFTGNQLTGEIPAWLGELSDLTTIYIHQNQFSGQIPPSLGNLNKLTRLYLQVNKLTGPIPAEIGNLSQLAELYLWDNQLSGEMPASIGNLTNLVTTFFYNNKLTGVFPNVSNLTKLEKIDGTNNQFTGISPSVLSLPKLIQLKFNYNKLTSIPNIAQAVNKANLTADLMYNYLDFTDLEPLFATVPHGIYSLKYGGQYVTNLNGGSTVPVPQGSTLILQAPPKGTYTTVTWERQTGPTTWTNVNSLNEDATGQTFKLSNVTSAINGYVYRVRMSNTRVTGVQLTGDPLTIQVTESYVANDADPANTLYNGLITAMRWRTDKPHGLDGSDLNGMYRFQYDEKYQIKDANWATHNGVNYTLQGNQYRVTNLTYDPNGNIQTLNRYDQNGVRTNQFAYTYAANKNQLQSVTGYANAYTYNSLGQMISVDKADKTNETAAAGNGDQTIEYDVTGKVTKVYGQSASQIGYYKMDGSGANSWGPMEAGTIYSTPVLTEDHDTKSNSAYLFDGIDDSMIIPDVADKTSFKATDFTVAVRVKKLVSINGSAHEALIGKWNHASNPGTNEWLLAIGNNGNANTAAMSIETGTTRYQAVGTTVLQANTWYHVVGQREGDQLKIYVNGQLEGSVNIGNVSINNTASQLFVARMLGGFMTNCAIADIQIFNRALKDDEIKALNKSNTGELLVSNLYDDRGFRLAKVNHTTSKTTWYIRDASGNTVNTYEQDNSTGTLNQTEIPVYASGKLGIYYPQQDGSMAYEITDHLGNVRALVREHVNIYQATMEDNGLAEYTNPRVQEMNYFSNIFETEVDDYRMNHTAPMPGVEESPTRAAYLYWINGQTTNKSVGPALALKVGAKDTVKLETWVRYENKPTYARNLTLLALSQLLGNSFAYQPGFEANTPTQTTAVFNNVMGTPGLINDGTNTSVPFAYLNYILFDENMQWIDAGFQRVTSDAGFDAGQETHPGKKPVRLAFDSPLVIPQNGYIYVWVSNESEATKVWFDDLTIVHTQAVVTQATDFGVWGDVLRELKSDNITYRHGYQGQFAEKDAETGWNHFELREYDPVIGRTLTIDPARQFHSPYAWVGNNPVSGIDPTGGFSPPSTHTDSKGNVVAVYKDGDLGVYRHDDLSTWDGLSVLSRSGVGISLMGYTAFWDEFVSPESGEVFGRINFGASWKEILDELHQKSKTMDLIEIAQNSKGGRLFDLKKDYPGEGRLLDGRYVSSRSAGNYLAAFNAAKGKLGIVGVNFVGFMKLAGALHVHGKLGIELGQVEMAMLLTNSHRGDGPSPAYGENTYCYRMCVYGWGKARRNLFDWNAVMDIK